MQETNRGELPNLKNKLLAGQAQKQIYQYMPEAPTVVGVKPPNEFELGNRFNVGRSTIQEAVKLLISRGILGVRRGSGTYVVGTTSMSVDLLGLGAVENKMALTLDLINVCIILGPGIAEVATLNATQEDILRLRNLYNSVEWKIKIGDSYIEGDIAFHACVTKHSKNRMMEQLIPIIDTAVLMLVNVTCKKLTGETIITHRTVTEAIAEHDPIGAKTAVMIRTTFNRNMIRQLIGGGREAWEHAGSVTAIRECDDGADI